MFLRIIACCLLVSGVAIAVPFPFGWNDEARAHELENIAKWKAALSEAEQAEGEGKLRVLAPGLRMMGDWMRWDGRNPEVDTLFQETRKTMIDVPGYASLMVRNVEQRKSELISRGVSTATAINMQSAAASDFLSLKALKTPESVAASPAICKTPLMCRLPIPGEMIDLYWRSLRIGHWRV